MSEIIECIKREKILISDGAIGTLILNKYLKAGECPELINLNNPSILENIALSYLEAGAEMIQTNTFGASRYRLINYSLENKIEEINRSAIKAVKRVIGNKAYIIASCGPSGRLLKPYGDVDTQQIRDNFKEQMSILLEEGIDAICIETMTDINETRLAIEAAKSLTDKIPIIATMTFDYTPKGFYTVMGCSIKEAALAMQESGADIIGSNCGNGIDNMIKIANEFKNNSSLPIIIQSNAGLPSIRNGEILYPETPEYMAEKATNLAKISISIIGGCCGTTPTHIKAIRDKIKPLQQI